MAMTLYYSSNWQVKWSSISNWVGYNQIEILGVGSVASSVSDSSTILLNTGIFEYPIDKLY